MGRRRKNKDDGSQGRLWEKEDLEGMEDLIDSSQWSGIMSGELDLISPRFRYFVLYPDQWWAVLSDLAKIAGYSRDTSNAEKVISEEYVKSVQEVFPSATSFRCSLQLQPHQLLVSRWGAYELFIRSTLPKAEPIKRQLFELIDEALGVGGKSLLDDKAIKEQERLGSTAAFAIERSELRAINREFVNATPMQHVKFYNNRWSGLTGHDAAYWRNEVNGPPLDRSSELTVTLHKVATYMVQTKIRLAAESGEAIDSKEIPEMVKKIALQLRDDCIKEFGPGADFGVSIEKRKGKKIQVVDMVRKQLDLDPQDP